jgi:hypothetical protein
VYVCSRVWIYSGALKPLQTPLNRKLSQTTTSPIVRRPHRSLFYLVRYSMPTAPILFHFRSRLGSAIAACIWCFVVGTTLSRFSQRSPEPVKSNRFLCSCRRLSAIHVSRLSGLDFVHFWITLDMLTKNILTSMIRLPRVNVIVRP